MEYQTRNQDFQTEPVLSKLPSTNKKRAYQRWAWFFGPGPIIAFLFVIYIWGIVNLFASASTLMSAEGIYSYFNIILIPSTVRVLALLFPMGLTLAIYFGIKSKRTPVSSDVEKRKTNWKKLVIIGLVVLLVLILIPILAVWQGEKIKQDFCGSSGCGMPVNTGNPPRIPVVDRLEKEVEESRAEARDALGEATLSNLRSRAEIYAFSKLDVSYEGWCDTVEYTPPGLVVDECVDTGKSWALSARTTGTNLSKCVDSENSIVDGAVSIESGLCEQGEIQVVTTSSGSGENQVTTKSNLSAQEIERITNESIDKINEVANSLDGIELQIVTAIPNLESGETKEWQGMTFESVGDYPVIMIRGTATTRSDLAGGIYPYSKSFLNVLMNTPNFDALLPTSALTQANDIEFDMAVVVTGE